MVVNREEFRRTPCGCYSFALNEELSLREIEVNVTFHTCEFNFKLRVDFFALKRLSNEILEQMPCSKDTCSLG
jgi:hypothetical protein